MLKISLLFKKIANLRVNNSIVLRMQNFQAIVFT